jgi:hypothetical protein
MRLIKNSAWGIAAAGAFTFVVAALLTACSMTPWSKTPFRPPADVAHLRLEGADSARVIVDKIWLERKEHGLVVTGYVMAKVGVEDTMESHLIVSLRDANGVELRSASVDFAPRQVPRQRRPLGVSQYRLALDPLPPNTAAIVVTARDDRPAS